MNVCSVISLNPIMLMEPLCSHHLVYMCVRVCVCARAADAVYSLLAVFTQTGSLKQAFGPLTGEPAPCSSTAIISVTLTCIIHQNANRFNP